MSSAIQIQLSLKPRTFTDSFVPYLESTSNFKRFEKEDDRDTYFISKITVKDLVRPLWKKHCFRATFESQQGKGYQVVVKSA